MPWASWCAAPWPSPRPSSSCRALGVNIAGLLAFGGVGGIAAGLAAKSLLANLFGGLSVYLDHPFRIGDWIRSPDREIEGTVEEIGWRRTLIRTFDMRPLYVPNALFMTISVENPSRMLNRRTFEKVGVRYEVHFDQQSDVLDIRLDSSRIVDSEEVKLGILLNYNDPNQVVGIEVLNAVSPVSLNDLRKTHVDIS